MPAPDALLRRVRELPAAERRLALAAACRLTLVQAFLTLRGAGPVIRRLRARQIGTRRLQALAPDRVAWLVEAVDARLPWPTTCLGRAVTAASLLLDEGWSCELVIGASAGPFAAHAWLERDGGVVGPPPAGYARVTAWRLPGGAAG